jgi:hypothetical protein
MPRGWEKPVEEAGSLRRKVNANASFRAASARQASPLFLAFPGQQIDA